MDSICKICFVVVLAALAGCGSFGSEETLPENIGPIPVIVIEGQSLRNAVIKAATFRRWIPEEICASTIRCTIIQRSNRVVVDVRLVDEKHYAIDMIESNIPARKVSQWVGNLQCEIAKWAAHP